MANEALKKMLEIGKKADAITASTPTVNPNFKRTSIEEQIQNYDNQVFGKYIPSENEQHQYSAEAEMERIKQRMNESSTNEIKSESKIPRKILESIIENPCNFGPDAYEDANVTALTKRISGKIAGVKSIHEIQKKLDESDNEKQIFKESLQTKKENVSDTIDYSLIKNIIENAIDEKMSTFKQSLNESINKSKKDCGTLKVMKMGSKFLFLDDEDNVYECKLEYVGKNKKRQ